MHSTPLQQPPPLTPLYFSICLSTCDTIRGRSTGGRCTWAKAMATASPSLSSPTSSGKHSAYCHIVPSTLPYPLPHIVNSSHHTIPTHPTISRYHPNPLRFTNVTLRSNTAAIDGGAMYAGFLNSFTVNRSLGKYRPPPPRLW